MYCQCLCILGHHGAIEIGFIIIIIDLCTCVAGLCGTNLFYLWAALLWMMKLYVQVSRDEVYGIVEFNVPLDTV